MSNYGSLLLSRVVDSNDVLALDRHNVTERHFVSETDKKAYRFIRHYAETNRSKAPSYAALVEAVPEFSYIPQVEDSYAYLTRRLFNEAAEEELANFINGEVDSATLRKDPDATLATMYENNASDMPALLEKLQDKLEDIRIRTDVRDKVGVDVKRDFESFLAEYRQRKEGTSVKTWASRYSCVGGYTGGNLYVVFGKSGRGKSVTTLSDAVYAAQQGANVLIWSLEMDTFETLTRIYAMLSADEGVSSAKVGGIDMTAGFSTSDLREGSLADDFEERFEEFLRNLNANLKGNITLRATDDDNFINRSLRSLEADIIQTEADFVVIDAFYHLDYATNTSRTAGGDAAETSKQLRRLVGRLKVACIAITQAEEVTEDVDDDGNRELVLPKRGEVKKTKSLLEDASTLIAVDTDWRQARGLVVVAKGRNGGEGDATEILYAPQFGLCRALNNDETSLEDFVF